MYQEFTSKPGSRIGVQWEGKVKGKVIVFFAVFFFGVIRLICCMDSIFRNRACFKRIGVPQHKGSRNTMQESTLAGR